MRTTNNMTTSQKIKCSRGWEDRCAYARCKDCRCACGGANHGAKRSGYVAGVEIKEGQLLEMKDGKVYPLSTPTQLSLFPTSTGLSDEKKRAGYIIGKAEDRSVTINGEYLDPAPSQKLYNHSPDGFNWGYGGSGPAQLALAILLKLYDKRTALDFYQSFKWDIISQFEQGKDFAVSVNEVHNNISKHQYLTK